MKTLWIVANWKSNKTITEALEWVSQVGPALQKSESVKVVVCPPFTDVEEVKKAVLTGNYPMLVGTQDLSPFDVGAYTGEEPAVILKDLVDLAILGHSERRKNFSETDEMVAKKAEEALKYGIIPLICVQDESTPVPENVNLVAYEPIWAIGSGTPDTPENADQVAGQIKQRLSREVEILYGGSVKSDNTESFLKQENINGLLIGGASLDPVEFSKIITISYVLNNG